MATIVIKDLEENRELDRKALAKIVGAIGSTATGYLDTPAFSLTYGGIAAGAWNPLQYSVWDVLNNSRLSYDAMNRGFYNIQNAAFAAGGGYNAIPSYNGILNSTWALLNSIDRFC